MSSVYDYIIQGIPKSSLQQSARTASAGYYGESQKILGARRKRKELLQGLIKQGTINEGSLGPNDRQLIQQQSLTPTGSDISFNPKLGKPSGTLSDILHLPFNFFKGAAEAGIYAVPGLAKIGSNFVQDVAHNVQHPNDLRTIFSGKSELNKDIIKPVVQDYKATYGPGGGSFWEHFKEDPFGPVMDAATIASLGLLGGAKAGALASKAARVAGREPGRVAQAASNIISREGRAPLQRPHPGLAPIPREYTPRPLSRAAQKFVVDPFAERFPIIKTAQIKGAELRQAMGRLSDSQHDRFNMMKEMLTGSKVWGHLTPNESQALFLTELGVNSSRRIAGFEDMVRVNTLEDPKAMNRIRGQDIHPDYVANMAKLPDEVKQLINDPNKRMIAAHELWSQKVDEMRAAQGMDLEAAAAHVAKPQQIIDEHIRKMDAPGYAPQTIINEHRLLEERAKTLQGAELADAMGDIARLEEEYPGLGMREPTSTERGPVHPEDTLPHPAYPIEPTYVPMSPATGFEPSRGFHIPDNEFVRTGGSRAARIAGLGGAPIMRPKADIKSGFVPQQHRFMHESEHQTFKAGTFRTDAKAYVDHLTQRAKSVVDEAFKVGQLERIGAKDPETGKAYEVADYNEMMDLGFKKKDYEIVHKGATVQWFMSQVDNLDNVMDVLYNVTRDLESDFDISSILHDGQLEEMLGEITNTNAKAFLTEMFAASRTKGYIVPKAQAKLHMKIANLDLPQANSILRFFGTWMNRWRGAVLTWMPRWWINTFVGSFLMNMLQGVNLHDYWIAHQWQKEGRLPSRVNLSHQPLTEFAESQERYSRQLMPGEWTQKVQYGVQATENFFRRGAFVHNLRREQRLSRDHAGAPVSKGQEVAQALEDIGDEIQTHHEDVIVKHGGKLEDALNDPQVVQRSIDGVDKFSYNYKILSPDERKYVRNFIPFWGWYKFISMAAYRLPFEMPGRVNAMRTLSNVAAEQEAELGPIPPWVRGTIPISLGAGRFTYLTTLGINPFAQFINPLGPKGPVAGLLGGTQLNPLIQAGLQGLGYDPLTGQGTRISPESGVGVGFLGGLVDENTGQPVNLAERDAGWRVLHSLLYALPQVRLGASGDTGVFPEHIPYVHHRPLPGSKRDAPISHVFGIPPGGQADKLQWALGFTGLAPKDYRMGSQQVARKQAKYVKKKNQRARQKLANQ